MSLPPLLQLLAQRLTASLSVALQRSVGNYFNRPASRSGGPGGATGRTSTVAQSIGSFFRDPAAGVAGLLSRLTAAARKPDGGSNGVSPTSPGKRPGGGGSQSSGSSPARPGTAPPGPWARLMNWIGQRHATRQAQQHGQAWWQRGWGNQPGGLKRSAFSRAARLQTIAARRAQGALRAVKASFAQRHKPGWNAVQHKGLVAAARSARQRLAQATGLQARATSVGAAASGRVAIALGLLGGKLLGFASKVSLPIAVATAAVRLPFALSRINDSRLANLRTRGDYNSGVAASMAMYDEKTENLKALNARDTQASTAWLVKEQNKFREHLRPFTAMLANAGTNLLAGITWTGNKAFEGTYNIADWVGASVAELEQAARNGRLPSFANFKAIKEQMEKDAEAGKKADDKVFDRQFTNHAKGWEDAINNKQEARRNARPRRTLPPLR